jgi:hypothetical protein
LAHGMFVNWVLRSRLGNVLFLQIEAIKEIYATNLVY